jgi:hypothetical protein
MNRMFVWPGRPVSLLTETRSAIKRTEFVSGAMPHTCVSHIVEVSKKMRLRLKGRGCAYLDWIRFFTRVWSGALL